MFVDASALIAMVSNEPEAPELTAALATETKRLTSGLAMWEATLAVARKAATGVDVALAELDRFCAMAKLTIVSIGAEKASEAVKAHMRYGKGTDHPARLNMGDCFAYACAKTTGTVLLYKGDDFSQTDLA